MVAVSERFTARAADATRAAIRDAGGNEVFLLGTLCDGKVDDVRVLARGNRHMVAAVVRVPRPGEIVIHNHPSGQLLPSNAEIEVASALGEKAVGSFIVDNPVEHIYIMVEPFAEPPRRPIPLEEAAALLAPEGPLASALGSYEFREAQMQMLSAVAQAFNESGILTVEAGTGTGKSLAYLIPAILWARANDERVVVSTHTIHLQEQLVQKDLPLLVGRAGLECETVLVKGRGNYLCQRKAAQIGTQALPLGEDDLGAELRGVLDWAKRTQDGSLSDLPSRPRPEVWEQVVSESDNCLRARCPYYSKCFFYSARRDAASAAILVVNHHLLMADLALRDELANYTQNAVLPPTKRVIIDEAHHLEDVATTFFSSQVSLGSLERHLGRLQRRRNPARGILPALQLALDSVEGEEDVLTARGAAAWIEERLLPRCQAVRRQAEQCFEELIATCGATAPQPGSPDGTVKVRITLEIRDTSLWTIMQERLDDLAAAADAYAGDMAGVLDRVDRLSDTVAIDLRYLATELAATQSRLSGFAGALRAFTTEAADRCAWLELRPRSRTGPVLSFHSAPIEVAPLLKRALFERFDTTVLTSATLATEKGFRHLHERLGIDTVEPSERVDTLLVDSPFDFGRQATFLVPSDLPAPNHPHYEGATHQIILAALQVSGGGTFVLFTAYGALNRAYTALEGELRVAGLSTLRQGEASRGLLLERFRRHPNSVLFATDSFWEGVDVKGEGLRCVIITRLPFKVPTEPIEQARVEAITAKGDNAFLLHSLPGAILKLKQGFGRLIRSRTDRGCVLLLDSRIIHRQYGGIILSSLPPARQLIAPSERILDAMRDSLGEDRVT